MTNLEDFLRNKYHIGHDIINNRYGLYIDGPRISFGEMYYIFRQFRNVYYCSLRAYDNMTKFCIYSGQPTHIPEIKINNGVRSNYICIDEFNLNLDILKEVKLI